MWNIYLRYPLYKTTIFTFMEGWEEWRKGTFRNKKCMAGFNIYVGITTFQVCIKGMCSLFL